MVQAGVEIPKSAIEKLVVKLVSTKVEIAQSEGEFDRWVGGFKDLAAIEA